jgi:hypothetical protein
MPEVPERVRAFLDRLLPKELRAYVPGGKLVAGVILAVLASVFGIGGETVVTIPGVGDLTVAALALVVGVYLYPEKEDSVDR